MFSCPRCKLEYYSEFSLRSHRGHCLNRSGAPVQHNDYIEPVSENIIRDEEPPRVIDCGMEEYGVIDCGMEEYGPDDIDDSSSDSALSHGLKNDDFTTEITGDDENDFKGQFPKDPYFQNSARAIRNQDLPHRNDPSMKYLNDQVLFGESYYGIDACNTNEWAEFKSKVSNKSHYELN